MIAIWRDIIGHYEGNPEKQREAFRELEEAVREAVMPPP